MAEGVAKTYRACYRQNLSRALELLCGVTPTDAQLRGFAASLAEKGLTPALAGQKAYDDAEAAQLKAAFGCVEGDIRRAQEFAARRAAEETDRATYQAMESLIHNLNTMESRSGSQTPFSSINYGMDTSPEGRLVMKNLLLATEAGLGSGETPIFPIQIFRVKSGVNLNEGEPNYDLFRLACRCSAKRLFPNFEFLDAPFNLQFYKEGDPDTEVATMGCVHGDSVVTYRLNGMTYVESIARLYDRIADIVPAQQRGKSEYMPTSEIDLKIWDSHSNAFVCVKTVLRNRDVDNWRKVTYANGRVLIATGDHPLPIDGRGRVFVDNIKAGDIAPISTHVPVRSDDGGVPRWEVKPVAPSVVGAQLSRIMNIESIDIDALSYDVETESDYFDVNGVVSHNCRTRVMSNINGPSTTSGRGNLSFTTINLPRLAIEAHNDAHRDGGGATDEGVYALFMHKLDETVDLVIRQLLERFEIQAERHVYNYPFLMGQGVWMDSDKLKREDTVRDVIKHGTLGIGFIGLAEAMKAIFGKNHAESAEVWDHAYKVVERIRNLSDQATKEHHLNFSVIATPAEGLSGRFVRIDKKEFGEIKGVTDRAYYTNSYHVPVYQPVGVFTKIDLEAPFHALCNGGHITYVELDGDVSKNPEAFEEIITYMRHAGIGYGSINHAVDYDPVCGYTGIINDVCPRCGRREGEGVALDHLEEILRQNGGK